MKKIFYFFVFLFFTATFSFAQENEAPLPLWTDTIVSQPEGYRMDAEGNVEITSSDGLVWLISTVNGLNGCEPDDFNGRSVRLANDIDFGEEGWNYCFSPIGTRKTPFLGTFDGDGHKIHHICQKYSRFDGVNNYFFDMGVFGYIRHATVKNVTLDSTCQITSSCRDYGYYRGGMVGFSDSLSIVDNIFVHSREISFYYGSCLVGMNRNSTVRNCACGGHDYDCALYEGAVLVTYNLCDGDYADAVVENCYFYGGAGEESFTFNLGGLVYFNETLPNSNGKQAVLRNCHSTPTRDFYSVHYYGTHAAVLSGESSIRYCYTDFSKTSFKHMIGLNEGGEVSDCCEYTNIDGIGTLTEPVRINDTTTDNLLDALNLWIANQEHPELYRTWTIINDSIPVFGDYYVGIPEHGTSTIDISVHPNPASGFVRIEGTTAAEVKVYNGLGQLVMMMQNTNELDLKGLSLGIYFVRIADEHGYEVTKKVVVE